MQQNQQLPLEGAGNYSIVVADDHPLVRAGILATLEREEQFQVIGEAADGNQVLELLRKHTVQLLILDLKMGETDPGELILLCREGQPVLKVLVCSAYTEENLLSRLRQAGVQGFVLKEEAPASLLQAVRVILSGRTWYSHKVRHKFTPSVRPKPLILTARETEVLQAVCQGKDNQAVAEQLGIAKATVRRNLTAIYAKLGVKNRIEAALWMSAN